MKSVYHDNVDLVKKQAYHYLSQYHLDTALDYIQSLQLKDPYCLSFYEIEADIFFKTGLTHKAIEVYKKAITITDDNTMRISLAKTLMKTSRYDDAYQTIIPIKDNKDFLNDISNIEMLVNICDATDKQQECFYYFDHALAITKNNPSIITDYIKRLLKYDIEKFHTTYKTYKDIISEDEVFRIERDLANKNNNYKKAIIESEKIKEKNASDWQIDANIANKEQRYHDALHYFRCSADVALSSDYTAKTNLAWQLLLLQYYEEGWQYYYYRHLHSVETANRKFLGITHWQGHDLYHKKIYIWAEQAIGDEITFATQLPEFIKTYQPASILCEIAPRLKNIFRESFPNIEFIDRDNDPDKEKIMAFSPHYMCAIGDIAQYTRKTLNDFQKQPHTILKVSKKYQEKYRQLLSPYKKNKKIIALSWTTSRRHVRDADLNKICKILQPYRNDIILFNVQYGDVDDVFVKACEKYHLDYYICKDVDIMNDIDDLCAMMIQSDIIISISNFTAVLSGSLGIDTFVITPAIDHWYRGLTGNKSLWYPSHYLFRRPDNFKNNTTLLKKTLINYLKEKNIIPS